jgi:hypothetical protein
MQNNLIINKHLKKQVMKKIILFAAIVLMAGFSTKAMAADLNTAKTISANVGTSLIVPMTITKVTDLNFGTITLLTSAGGTVVLSASNEATYAEGILAPSSSNSSVVSDASYTVTGTMNATYALTLPSTVIPVTETTLHSASMDITAFTARFNTEIVDATTSKISSLGVDDFKVGATLTVKPSQIGGIYAGTFPVTVDYN